MIAEPSRALLYRFGVFEVFPEAGEVYRQGHRVKLQEQPFRLLITLVEHPGEIVTREALCQRLWPENTFVEFDQSLGTAVTKLRQALGDDAENPRFVETVPKRGYRFLAPVTCISPEPAAPSAANVLDLPLGGDHSVVAHAVVAPHRRSRRNLLLAVGAASLVVVAAFVFLSWRWGSSPKLSDTDTVILAGFENSTGDAAFDDALYRAVRLKLQESPFLNLVAEGAARAVIQKPAGKPDEDISFEEARLACAALASRVIIHGQVWKAGDEFRVRVLASPCGGGRAWYSEEATVSSPMDAVSAVSLATDKLRRKLGEPEDSLQRFNTPIAQATSSSFAALKAFSVGEAKRSRGLDYESLADYKLAADLDPEFALAYARMGTIFMNSQENVLASTNYRKAFELRARTTERERLYITAHYYSVDTGDAEEAANAYLLWHQMYPRDLVPPNNLADIYISLGQAEKALEMAKEAVRLGPQNGFPYTEYAQAAQRLGMFAQAKEVAQQAIDKKLDGMNLHMVLFRIAYAEKDDAGMQRELDWARGNPREGEMLNLQAWSLAERGRIHDARDYFRKAEAVGIKGGLKEFAADVGEDDAQMEADFGFTREARDGVDRGLKLAPDDLNVEAFGSLILARTGEPSHAEKLAVEVERAAPQNTIYAKMVLPSARASEALHRNDPEAALESLKIVKPFDLARPVEMFPIYYRAESLRAAHRYDEAAAEFQRLLAHRAVCPVSPYLALAHLGIARARQAAGKADLARGEYQEFFSEWKDADADIPVLREARAEFSRLPSAAHAR